MTMNTAKVNMQQPDGIFPEFGVHPSTGLQRNSFARSTRELGLGSKPMPRALFRKLPEWFAGFANKEMSEKEFAEYLNKQERSMKPLFYAIGIFAALVIAANLIGWVQP